MSTRFEGFSPAALVFSDRLRFLNTVERQRENIVEHTRLISEPLQLLCESLLETVLRLGVALETKPSRCVSTPYTDRRFFPCAPLKEYVYIRFKQPGRRTDIPGLYFDMGADHYGYGIRIYKQTARATDSLRERVMADLDKYSILLDGFNRGFLLCSQR